MREELAKWRGEQAVESFGELGDAVADIERIMQSNKPDAVKAPNTKTPARHWNYPS
ncbi:hypothetical protein [Pseudomarimonas arenosa]|uniref:Uncharacterized protein n=1 Tax=Pseudomarimonas arenosa TaxID=2774145 RepID=A0AAW3ZI80_9GAMM|nr:hypothetical protein [Pseudomarimonas arenosa]MBD8524429.1 hypothetical protein [Pseudomarimonas arenosa]